MKRSFILLMSLLLCAGTMVKAAPTDLPQMTENPEAPVFYTISNTRSTSGKYLYYAGDELGLKDSNTKSVASLFYFTGTTDEMYVHNAATTKKLASVTSWTEEGTAWAINVTPYGDGTTGLSIGPWDDPFGGACWNEFTFNDGYTSYSANDAGSIFTVEIVEDFSIFLTDAKAAAVAELENLQTVSEIYPDATEAIAAVGAVTVESATISAIEAAIATVNQCVADYKATALQALGGKYFAINTPARDNGFMKVAGTQVSGAADASSSAAVWQFECADGVVKVFNPYTGKYLCEPGNNSTIVAVTENVAAAGAYQLVVYADAENDEAKVKLTSNGKSIHMDAAGVLVRWDNGGASEWTVSEIAVDVTAEITALLDANAENHAETPALGQYSTAGYTALQDAQNTVTTLRQVADAVAAFEAAKCLPVFTIDGVWGYALGMSVYESEEGSLLWRETEHTESMLWTFDMTDTIVGVTDKVVVKNLATGNLFWGASFIQVTETSEAVADDGLFLFYTEGTGAPVHAAQAGQTIVRWNNLSAASASAWKFTFAGTTYSINDLPEVPDTPVVPDTPEGVVNDLASADPAKCYSITTMGRGGWTVDAAGTSFTCTTAEGLTVDESDPRQQFAILSLNAQDYYLYSVSAKKFVKRDGSLVAGMADAIEFVDASSMGAGRVMVRFDEDHIINVSDASRRMEINNWSSLDEGNAVVIIEAGDFDATEALVMLSTPAVPDTSSVGLTNLASADPTKCYTISTNGRGAWAVDTDGTRFSTTGVEEFDVDAADARQQFAILSANGEDYYLYSVSAKKFVKQDRSLVVGAGDAIEFVDASSFEESRVMVRFRDIANANINIGGDNQMVINSWGIIDEGNAVLIAEAGDFDAAEALAALADPEGAELNVLIAQVEALVEANADNHAVEPALGQYSTAAYEALSAAVDADSVSKASLEAAIAAFEAAKCLPVFSVDGVYDYAAGMSIYELDSELHWKETDRTDESMLWTFDMTDTIVGVTDRVVVKNLATGNYFDNTFFVRVTETEEAIIDDGLFLIYPEGMGYPLFADWNGRITRSTNWSANSTCAWKFTYVGTTYGANTPYRDALEVLLNRAKGYNPYSGSELGYYVEDFGYLLDAIAEAEALLLGEPSEAECEAMVAELSQAVEQFESSDKTFRLPELGKAYRIVSAFSAFYESQSVEKAITINASDNTLWWGDVCPDSLQQEFVFEPVLGDSGVHLSWNMDINLGNGTTVTETQYFYNLKHVATGLYASYNDSAKFHLDEQPCTVYLTCLGVGQFGLRFRVENEYGGGSIHCVHAGDHNNGVPSTNQGNYGGVFGISSGIVSWYGGLDTPSAWYIRECPARPDTPAPATVTELSAADPTKCYTISTNGRGAWAINAEGTYFSTTTVEGYDIDATDARQQFAILSANGEDYYLYSVSAKKFVKRDRTLAVGVGDAIEFVDASSFEEGRVLVRFRDFINANINIGGDYQITIDRWSTVDVGNAVLIAEAGDFDAAEALAALADPEAAELAALVAQVQELVEANAANHAVEPALGQYSTAAYDALVAVANTDSASKASLEAAIAAFEAAKCLPVFTITGFDPNKSIYESTNHNGLYWKELDRTDETMLWVFYMTDTIVGVTDRVVVKNLATGNNFGNGTFIQVTETEEEIADDGYFLIYYEGTGTPLCAYRNGQVMGGDAWSVMSDAAWKFTYAGTTYGINELPVEPDVLEPPVFTDTVDATMPLDYHAAADGWIEGTEWYDEAELIVSYTSPMYRFEEKVETFRIAVVKSQGKEQFFCLSELEFYEGNGQKIELTEGNVTSNADHNALNPSAPDGGGIAALFDGKTTTYFHSAWQNIPDEVHYLEVTLPNGGYDTFGFRMISRANDGFVDQSHTFPRRMIITDGDYQRMALSYLLDEAEMLDLYPFPELGYYYDDFSYLREAISEARDLVDNNASEAECEAMVTELLQALKQYKANETPCLRMPEPGKVYHIISAFENFYVNQQVEKAITVNDTLNTLWWEDVNSANLQQGFMFEPVLNGLGNIATQEMNYIRNGVKVVEKHYFFRMKHAATGLYVDYDDAGRFHLVEQPCTLRLSQPGNKHEGQFNILTSRYMGDNSYETQYLHAGDHNGGVAGTHQGAYGGIGGVSSGIISYYGGAGTPAAWYIREMHELPYTMPVSDAVFRSGFIHFDAADVITLTADRECSFAGLALRDEYGNWLHSLDSEVSGNTITLTLERKIASCAFQFTNYEGVSSVTFDAEASTVEVPSLQLVGVTPDSETSEAWVSALTLSFNKEITVWSLPDIVIRGVNTSEEFHINSHDRISENSDGGFDLTLYFEDADDAWTDIITVPDTYTYTIPAGAIKSVDGEVFPETTFTFTVDGTFSVVSYSPAETTSLEQIELTFDRVIEDITIYYGWYVYNEEGDAVAYIDWGSGHGSKTVTLGLNEPITTPGKYYLHIFADAFTAEGYMPNMPTDIIFTVVEDTQNTAKPGDVNGDGNFTMIDVVMTVNAVLEKEQTGFNANAADLNGDGQITMVDVVGVLRLVLTDDSAMAPARSTSRGVVVMPELSACEFSAMNGNRVVLPVALDNVAAYSAFQMDVVLPTGVELAEATLTGRAKAGHTVAWNTLSDGTVRVVAYAVDNNTFRGNEGDLLNLVFSTSDKQLADAEVTLTDALFATADGEEHRAADVSVMMRSETTGIDEAYTAFRVYGIEGAVVVECGADIAVSIYAVTGELVQQTTVQAGKSTIVLPAGVYIVNSNKVIVK